MTKYRNYNQSILFYTFQFTLLLANHSDLMALANPDNCLDVNSGKHNSITSIHMLNVF